MPIEKVRGEGVVEHVSTYRIDKGRKSRGADDLGSGLVLKHRVSLVCHDRLRIAGLVLIDMIGLLMLAIMRIVIILNVTVDKLFIRVFFDISFIWPDVKNALCGVGIEGRHNPVQHHRLTQARDVASMCRGYETGIEARQHGYIANAKLPCSLDLGLGFAL